VLCVVPAFLGESHFAFLGYSQNFRQTPVKRELDYLRTLGASKAAAKELKLFGLSSFLIDRYNLAGRTDLHAKRRPGAQEALGVDRCSRC